MTPTTSFGLIELAKAGDQAAFERLFARYSRRLAVLINYKLGPESHAAPMLGTRVGLNEIRTDEFYAVLVLEEERDRLDREQVGTG